jgi:hypothetical protein
MVWIKKRPRTYKEDNITVHYEAVKLALGLIPTTHTSIAVDKIVHFTEWRDEWGRLYFREVTAQTAGKADKRALRRRVIDGKYLYGA